MKKTCQIPETLLYDLFSYFLRGETDEDTERAIVDALETKLDAMIRHDLYSRSKTADTPQERETARQAYLDQVGMRQSYRWPEGYQNAPGGQLPE